MNIDQQAAIWDTRYGMPQYAYGTEPNVFLKEQLSNFAAGKALFPADGEGRNGVYAATLGWDVSAFDLSEEGRKKALDLAKNKNVNIKYNVGDYSTFGYSENEFDLMVFIFAHFSGNGKINIHHDLNKFLKPGGIVIFEGYSKNHLAYQEKYPRIGGPKDLDTLWSEAEIKVAFPGFEIIALTETETELNEGDFHKGLGSVIRFIGQKA